METATYQVLVDWNNDGLFTGTYDDITLDVKEVKINRGKDRQLSRVPAATCEILLHAGLYAKYSALNAAGVLYGDIYPYRPVRVAAIYNSFVYDRFNGFLKKIRLDPHPSKQNVSLYCVDAMERFGHHRIYMEPVSMLEVLGTASDGFAQYTDNVWATAHDAANAENIFAAWHLEVHSTADMLVNYKISRTFLYFNTAALPNDCTIVSAFIRLYNETHMVGANRDLAGLCVVEGIQSDPFDAADYGDHLAQTTLGAYLPYDDIPEYSLFEIPLNTVGMAWINKTGTTKFCLRLKGDVDDVPPTDAAGNEFLQFTSYDDTGVKSLSALPL